MKGNVMNTLSKLTLVAIVIFGMSSVATAADYTAEQLMSLMDTNGDGKITLDEAPEDLKAGFGLFDQNGDGGIDVKEAQIMADFADNEQSQSPAADAGGITAEHLMSLLDTDRDGKITLDEAPEDLKAGFGLFDRNGDGGIDVTEAQVLVDFDDKEQSPEKATAPTAEQLMALMDANRDGKITLAEAPEDLKVYFFFIDQNGDGGIDVTEAQVLADLAANEQSQQEAPAAPRSQAAELYAAQALRSRAAAPPLAPVEWVGDLSPISESDWSYERARHLLERAGFGGTPEDIRRLADMTPQRAVDYLVDYEELDNSFLPEFDESDIYYGGYPATDNYFASAFKDLYKYGDMFGIKLLPPDSGPLHMQAAVTEAFYVYIADGYETKRLAEWWGERMVRTNRPLEEKLAYFWHGHFATSNAKALRYDLMKLHYETLRDKGLGSFKDLLIAVSQDPQMLIWLDNRTNTKRHPNENFAREVMELFSMGVGNYTEEDIREISRAFTGWTLDEEGLKGRNATARRDLVEAAKFVDDPSIHDGGEKTFLGESGNFNGYDAIDIILKQDATARFITWKLYRFFCNYEVPEEINLELARRFRADDYEIRPLLKTMFLSKDFYSPACVAKQIKSPVEQVVSTYRKLGLDTSPGIPNFGVTTAALGQELLFPPNVAGWEGGPSWINPATLLDRGNFARNLLFPGEVRGAGFDEGTYMMMNMGYTQGLENAGYVAGESDEDFDRRMNEIIETTRQARINRGGSLGATSLYESPETTTSAVPAAAQLMSFMDTNGDGKITMEEAPEDIKTAFAFIDQNGDGGIDVKEAQIMVDFNNNGQSPLPAAATAPDYTAAQLMSFMDTNGDGKIAKDEVNRLTTSFEGLDKNADGEIDAAEAGGMANAPRKEQTPSPQQATGAATPEQLMALMDTNSDGKITMEEAPEELKAGFSFIDANSDGAIDLKEAQVMAEYHNNDNVQSTQPQQATGAATAEQLMALMDTNNDGKITMEEAPEELKAGFSFIDANSDGAIDLKEAQVMADYANNENVQSTQSQPTDGALTVEQAMAFMDTNRDGKITMEEAPEDWKAAFSFIDANGDGGIDLNELQVMSDFGNNGQPPEPMAGGIDMSDRKNRFANPAETFHLEMGFGLATMKAKARVKPMQKIAADIQLVDMAREAGVSTIEEAVDHFAGRLLLIPLGDEAWVEMVAWMYDAVGSSDLDYEAPNAERVLRRLAHLIMSLPEYQLG